MNGVNFEIKNIATKEVKIVPCDRLTPVKENNTKSQRLQHNNHPEDAAEHDSSSETDSDYDTFRGDALPSDYEPSSSDKSSAESEVNDEEKGCPVRNHVHRHIPGEVPWSAVPKL